MTPAQQGSGARDSISKRLEALQSKYAGELEQHQQKQAQATQAQKFAASLKATAPVEDSERISYPPRKPVPGENLQHYLHRVAADGGVPQEGTPAPPPNIRRPSQQMADDFTKQGGAGGRPGDWICPQCNNINFASRKTCKKCPSTAVGAERIGLKQGDWICPQCGDLVFASRSKCKMCDTKKPANAEQTAKPHKPTSFTDTWSCPNCSAKQNTNYTTCQVCGTAKNAMPPGPPGVPAGLGPPPGIAPGMGGLPPSMSMGGRGGFSDTAPPPAAFGSAPSSGSGSRPHPYGEVV